MDFIIPEALVKRLFHTSFIFTLRKEIKRLEYALKKLEDESKDRRQVADACLTNGMVVTEGVTKWLEKAKCLIVDVQYLLHESKDLEMKRFLTCCCPPKICWSSFSKGKKMSKMIEQVHMLCSETFNTFSYPAPLQVPVFTDPTELTEGQNSTFNKVWGCLQNEQDPIVFAIVGKGGIGKTTVLRKLHHQLLLDKSPENLGVVVIFSRVSQVPNLNKIQDEIRRALGISDYLWENKSPNQKTEDLYSILSRNKFVLLLDDIWEGFNFKQVGVPLPQKNQNKSKVVFTTRSRDVCSAMDVDVGQIFPIEALTTKDAWKLFLKAVGDDCCSTLNTSETISVLAPDIFTVDDGTLITSETISELAPNIVMGDDGTLNSSETLSKLAQDIVRECQGLPLAIVTIGRALAKGRMDASVWENVLSHLQTISESHDKSTDGVTSALKLSYGLLNDDILKSCFRFCSLLPVADRDQLIDYWIGEGLIQGKSDSAGTYDNSRYQGHKIIGSFIRDSLLMAEGSSCVRMHDITREVALNIAKGEGEKLLVRAGAYLTEAPAVAEWKEANRVSLTNNGIKSLPESPYCLNLSTLILSKSGLKFIPDEFFEFMPLLKVLDLSWCKIAVIPRTIIYLYKLEYLNLSHTHITALPVEFKNLLGLKVLDLSYTAELNAIPVGTIAALSHLLVLNVYFCGNHEWIAEHGDLLVGGEKFIEELETLEKVNHLGISIKDVYALKRLGGARRVQLYSHKLLIMRCKGLTELPLSSIQFMLSLHELEIRDCADLEEIQTSYHAGAPNINMPSTSLKDIQFYNLRRVQVEGCWSLEELSWLSIVPNLETLHVHRCMNLNAVIKEKQDLDTSSSSSSSSSCAFPRLKSICLSNLPSLQLICMIGMSFCILEEIRVSYCPNLKELPFGVTADIPESFKLIEGQKNWWNKLEWKEENIKNDLLVHFRHIPY